MTLSVLLIKKKRNIEGNAFILVLTYFYNDMYLMYFIIILYFLNSAKLSNLSVKNPFNLYSQERT